MPYAAVAHAWPDALDLSTLLIFLLFVIAVPTLGYIAMWVDYQAYLRSLRRHIARIVYGGNREDVPGWAVEQTPRCIDVFDLRFPCTEDELKAAYRDKVKRLHPDRGGDQQRFMMLQRYFEQALAVVRENDLA